MIDYIETAKAAALIVGPVMGAGGLWAYLSERAKAATAIAVERAKATASMANTQVDLGTMLNEQTKLLLAESAKDRSQLKKRVDHQGRALTRVQQDVADCHKHKDKCESELEAVRADVARMMRENPPAGEIHINPHSL